MKPVRNPNEPAAQWPYKPTVKREGDRVIIMNTHRPVQWIDEVNDARRADGWRFYAFAGVFLMLVALTWFAADKAARWVSTDAVEMTNER